MVIKHISPIRPYVASRRKTHGPLKLAASTPAANHCSNTFRLQRLLGVHPDFRVVFTLLRSTLESVHRFVLMANGVMTQPKLSNIPGMTSFKGDSFHTSRWDYSKDPWPLFSVRKWALL